MNTESEDGAASVSRGQKVSEGSLEPSTSPQGQLPSPWLGVPSCVWPFVAPWTLAGQAPLSMEFSRQEYWSGLPFPSPGDLPNLGIEPCLLCLLCWQVGSLPYCHLGRCYSGGHPVRRKRGPYKEHRLFNPDFTEQLTSKRWKLNWKKLNYLEVTRLVSFSIISETRVSSLNPFKEETKLNSNMKT